ncbi:MAG: RHS repeat-associated core domain-containing protein, partial [Acidobacteriota bacterium]
AQQPGDAFPTRLRRRSSRITFWRETVTRLDSLVRPTVGGFDAKGFGLGGWNVDVHHVYDPARRTLYRGDGTQRVSWALGPVLNLFAGVGTSGYTGDGGDAKAARFDFPGDAAVGPDGSVYVADRSNYVVRRIAPSGIVTTVAGSGDRCVLSGGGSKGENGDDEGKGGGGPGTGEPCAEDLPALDASFNAITGIDVDRFGRLYIVDRLQRCVFRLEAGIVRRVAGVCALPDDGGGGKGERGAAEGFGDGSPALDAFFDAPFDVAVMPDGTFYISDRDGDLVRYVLGGRIYSIETSEALFFSRPQSLHAVDDGTLYIAENQRILRYDRSGTLSVIAGTSVDAISPDGADAATSPIDEPGGVLATDDGRVYFVEQGSQTLRYVDGEGTLRTAAGNGQRNDTAPGAPARATPMRGPQGLALSPSGVVLIVDGFQDRIFALEGPMSDYDDDGYRVTEPGGRVIHEFDAQGRHLQTVHGLTSATLLSFGYDDAGLLTSITDADGQATTVARGGATTTITGPFGQVNTLAIDAQGDLASLANPASEAHSFTYGFGLLEAATDPRGGVKAYRYDARGRLETAEDEGDGRQTFSRFKRRGSDDHTVRRTTAEGVESRFVLRKWSTGQELRTQRLPDGETVETVTNRATGETTRVTLADAQLRRSRAPDPRFGMQAGFDQRAVARMPSGLTRERTTTQSASFATPGDLSTFESLRTTSTINGRTSTRDYDAATRRWTVTSAAGRIAQVDTDARARITRLASPQAAPVTTTYTASGRIETLTRGASPGTSRVTQFGYDARNRLDTITDPTLRVLRFEHDDADRVTRIVLPDTAAIDLDHDVNGNLIAVTPPGRSAYGFTYTPTNRLETLTLPDTGQGVATETRVYDRDQRLTGITRHDGRQIAYAYDPDEQQLVAITSPRGVTTLRYDEPTDQLAQIVDPDGETLAFTYDGPLRTGVAWSGTVQGDVDWTFDSDFRPATESVNGAGPITYSYDPDSRLLGAGALVVTREPTTGREATTALGLVGSTRTYTPFGELDTHTVTYDGQVIYSEDLDYDDRGWIDGIQRMQNGTGSQWTYGYDLRGRLETVTRDALPFADYTYDTNGNRLSTSGPFGSVTPAEVTVDARDRVLAYGDRTYTYRDDGSRATQTQSGQTVSYGYDVFGNLRSVDLGDGTVIDYVTDGQQRRIGKRVNGALTQRLLYRDALNPIAMLAADGSVETRFVYGTRPNVPDYMVRGGVTYRVVADHLGSPRLIVDVATGAIAQELRYDAFGRVLLDTNPGFQPFGFAGGLYDPQTGLVRLGARDYDPVLGRWTAPDALGFAGTMSNLYTYARNSPVTYLDVNGLAERSFPVDRDATTSFISEINEIAESGGADIPIGDFLKTLNLPEEELKRLNDRRGDITLKFPDPTQGEFCNSGEKTTVPIPGAGPLSLKIKDEFSGDIEVSEDSIKLDGLKGLSAGVGFARKGVDSLTIEPGLVTVEF